MLSVTNPAEAEETFDQCVRKLQLKGLQEGIAKATIEDVLGAVKKSSKVIELDRQQPEFTSTFTGYLTRRVTQSRVDKGRRLYQKHRKLLNRITRETGVPGHYLVAFWGLETNYGGYKGKMSTINSLTTLACDKRRSKFFSQQLFAALKLIEKESIPVEQMKGSWAGAVGHVQFMPSVYLKYARDGDGDKRRDLWNSIDDALLSAGHYLNSIGWETGTRWGREVVLPKNFPYEKAGRQHARSLKEWADLGILDAHGRPLPRLDMRASLLIPSGHEGPAFLVYKNFRIIMNWNRSEFYALSVGYLADRIAGAGILKTPPPENSLRISREMIKQLQQKLNQKGYAAGKPDGIFGPASRTALSQYQQAEGLIADGHVDDEILTKLEISI